MPSSGSIQSDIADDDVDSPCAYKSSRLKHLATYLASEIKHMSFAGRVLTSFEMA